MLSLCREFGVSYREVADIGEVGYTMLSQVFQVKDSEVVGASGCRVFGGTDGFSDQVRDERQEVWVNFVTIMRV